VGPRRPQSAGWPVSGRTGYTLVEILVAFGILLIVVTGVMRMVAQGDRIRGRARQLSFASIACANESEYIRKQARYAEPLNDTVYDLDMGRIVFEVRRDVIEDDRPPAVPVPATREIELTVSLKSTGQPIRTFRLLQGYYR